jgi:hypothetical protein
MKKLIGILSLLIIITSCDVDLDNKGEVNGITSAYTDNRYKIKVEFKNLNHPHGSSKYTKTFDLPRPFSVGDSLILDKEYGLPLGYVKKVQIKAIKANIIYVSYRSNGSTQSTAWFTDWDKKFKVGDDVYIRKYMSKKKVETKESNKTNNKFIE